MSFTKKVRDLANPIWQASFDHPFVQGIADGTLPLENFRYYVLQDSYYLSHFARVQALAGAKATDLQTTARFAAHAQGTYNAELSLHHKFSAMLGITKEEKQQFQASPTAYAYTSHLYRAAYGHVGDILAAILPCYLLYYEIGEQLKDATPKEPIYQEWISAYGGEWFQELVKEQVNRLDELAETVTDHDRKQMAQHFLISSQYEYEFWEMANQLEKWPLPKSELVLAP